MATSIPNITLSNGVKMPALGIGTWQLTGTSCINSIKDALKLGYTLIDTAVMYGNHKEIGRAIKGHDRKSLFITTKIWHDDLRYDDVLSSFDKSLKNLGTDYVDLILIHWPNKNIPLKETFLALKKVYDEKKARAVGVSNFTEKHLEDAKAVTGVPIAVNQVEFHPFLYQKSLLEYCKTNKIAVTAYSPLARGEVFKSREIYEIAKRYNKSRGQVALRWLIEKGISAIPKASSMEHLSENLKIFDFRLASQDMQKLDSLGTGERMINPSFAEF